MKTEIYYFSGTGNSLFLARDIAQKIGGKLIAIPTVMDQDKISIDSDILGIVFPTYYETMGGVPLIVRRFVKKLENIETKYIFAICSYGGASFTALKLLDKLIKERGGNLNAKFTVNMPSNMAGSNLNNLEKQEKMFNIWDENIGIVCEYIKNQKDVQFNTPNTIVGRAYILFKLIYTPLIFLFKPTTVNHLKKYSSSSLPYEEQLPFMDKSFSCNEKCIGCGTCLRICPVGNIKMVNERPSWQHQCEFCLACFHWCTEEAIISRELKNTVKYHHPDVKLSDMTDGNLNRRL